MKLFDDDDDDDSERTTVRYVHASSPKNLDEENTPEQVRRLASCEFDPPPSPSLTAHESILRDPSERREQSIDSITKIEARLNL